MDGFIIEYVSKYCEKEKELIERSVVVINYFKDNDNYTETDLGLHTQFIDVVKVTINDLAKLLTTELGINTFKLSDILNNYFNTK